MIVKTPRGKTVKELIASLQQKKIDKVYGRSLSRCLKEELEEFDRNTDTWSSKDRHYSHSQADMYRKCGLQYYWRYICGWKSQPNASQTLGGAGDETFNFHYDKKIKTGKDEPLSVLTDYFHENFSGRREETLWGVHDPDEIEGDGLRMIRQFRMDLAPIVIPIDVQWSGDLEFENFDWIWVYKADLIADLGKGDVALWDNKTSRKSITQKDCDQDDQLTGYDLAYSLKKGKQPALLGFHAMVALKTKCTATQLETTRTQAQHYRYLREVARCVDGIRKRVFTPAFKKTWVCSRDWCGYYERCHKEF